MEGPFLVIRVTALTAMVVSNAKTGSIFGTFHRTVRQVRSYFLRKAFKIDLQTQKLPISLN